MTKPIERIPFYIDAGRDVLLSWCHLPEKPTNHVVLICPPVGHEFINSYRGLRHLADEFAKAGVTVFRMEYQGVGDSSGLDTDPDRIKMWLNSIETVYHFIQKNCDVKQVSLFGLRMGGTLSAMLAEKLELQSLMCWVPVVEGRRYIREILALQRTGENADLDVDSSSLEGGGFLITRETMNDVLSISLKEINPTKAKNVILFNSDDMPTPNNLIEHWSSVCKNFQHTSLSGYANMMELPHHSKVPFSAIKIIIEMFKQTNQLGSELDKNKFLVLRQYQQARFDCYTYGSSAKESIDAGGFPISETLCQIPNTPLFGIFSLPLLRDTEHKPTVLLLNAGSVHRIGPNRNYVYLARQLLSQGFSVMRIDFIGLGDSVHNEFAKENDPYTTQALQNVESAIAFLKENFAVEKIILMGICSGAYSSYQTALHFDDPAIEEIIAINPLTFYWEEGMSLDLSSLEHHWNWSRYVVSFWNVDSWLKLVKGQANIVEILKTTFSRMFIKLKTLLGIIFNKITRIFGREISQDLAYDLNKVYAKGIKILFVFAESDPGYQILMESAGHVVRKLLKDKNFQILFISKANHNFSSHLGRSRLLAQLAKYFSLHYE